MGVPLITLDRINSTNDYALALSDAPEGLVVRAVAQEAGRGRHGAAWQSEPGKNLTFSVVTRPGFVSAAAVFDLARVVALGVSDALRSLAPELPVSIKWPNDILIGENKVAGILIENHAEGARLVRSVWGVGLNVNQTDFSAVPRDGGVRRPTSLALATGREFELDATLAVVLSALEARYLSLRAGRTPLLAQTYLARLFRYQEWAEFHCRRAGERITAMITGVTAGGLLSLALPDGTTRVYDDAKSLVFL